MKVHLEIDINPVKKLPIDKSLKCAEKFLEQLLASDEAKRLAQECKVEIPVYQSKGTILHSAFGFANRSDKNYTYICWEQEVGEEASRTKYFPSLDPAAMYNGNIARDW